MATGSFNNFPAIAANAFPQALSRIVRKVAFDAQAEAQKNAPVDTGFLKNSIYVVTHNSSTYGQGASEAPKDAELLDEVEKPDDEFTAYIAVGASYGIYVEEGTRFQAPQPYLLPAIEDGQFALEEAIETLETIIDGYL